MEDKLFHLPAVDGRLRQKRRGA